MMAGWAVLYMPVKSGREGGAPPSVDLEAEAKTPLVREAIAKGLASSAKISAMADC